MDAFGADFRVRGSRWGRALGSSATRRFPRRQALTLIELLVVIAIVGTLVAILLLGFGDLGRSVA